MTSERPGGGAERAGGDGEGAADARPSGEEAGASGGDRPARTGDDLLAEAVDRMAHQIKNPLQAVAMNLEVIRMRVRKEAPDLWSGVERYGEAVDQNVSVLDRRLRLLLRLGRRSPDEAPESVDVGALIRDFADALQLDEEPPRLVVDAEGEQLAARARPGYVLALVFDLWRSARTGGSGPPELGAAVRAAEGEVVLEVGPRHWTAVGDPGGPPARWRDAADHAGGRLEVERGEEGDTVRLVLPGGADG